MFIYTNYTRESFSVTRNLAGRPIEIFDAVGPVKCGFTHSELVTVSGISKISLSMLKNIKKVSVRSVFDVSFPFKPAVPGAWLT